MEFGNFNFVNLVQLGIVVINIELNAGRIVILFCECDAEINRIYVRQLETKHRHLDCLDFIQNSVCEIQCQQIFS